MSGSQIIVHPVPWAAHFLGAIMAAGIAVLIVADGPTLLRVALAGLILITMPLAIIEQLTMRTVLDEDGIHADGWGPSFIRGPKIIRWDDVGAVEAVRRRRFWSTTVTVFVTADGGGQTIILTNAMPGFREAVLELKRRLPSRMDADAADLVDAFRA